MQNKIKSHSLRTIREEFNEYELEDGNILRIKDVLIGFGFGDKVEKKASGQTSIKAFVSIQQVIGIIPTGDVDTSGLELLPNRIITEKDRKDKMKFTEKQASINLYETDEHLIIVRGRLNQVWTTPFKDRNDIPIYSLNSQSAVDAPPKNTFARITDLK